MKKTNRPAWYGGNKIPASYLAKFLPPPQHEDLPYDLRLFMEGLKK
jgi:hypothetical protein